MTTIVIHANHSTVAELKAYEEMIDAKQGKTLCRIPIFLSWKQSHSACQHVSGNMCWRSEKGLAARLGRLKNQHA